jgi:hypothetical protein
MILFFAAIDSSILIQLENKVQTSKDKASEVKEKYPNSLLRKSKKN